MYKIVERERIRVKAREDRKAPVRVPEKKEREDEELEWYLASTVGLGA